MPEWLSRTELLLGKERLEKLQQAHVLVAGLGGVGAYAAEQLCRAGIGEMTIIDGDVEYGEVNSRDDLIQKYRKSAQAFGGERFYQSLPKLNIIGDRPTDTLVADTN